MRHVIAAAALAGLMVAAQPFPAAAQMSPSGPMAQDHKPMMKKTPGHRQGHSMAMNRPGHRMDNIADKLNACQQRAQAERQMCMDQAAH